MGTRSLTTFIDDHTDEEIVVMYRQYDGYPGGHGRDLLNFINGIKVVNGIPGGKRTKQMANGIGCLAAQGVGHFKREVGYFYLYTADTRDHGEEFVYTIYAKDKELKVKVEDVYNDEVLFDGNTEEMDEWLGDDDRPNFDTSESKIYEKLPDSLARQKNHHVRQEENGFTD